jgi:retron-type reverse transcriptase
MKVINLLYKKYVDQATNESEVKIVFNTVLCAWRVSRTKLDLIEYFLNKRHLT